MSGPLLGAIILSICALPRIAVAADAAATQPELKTYAFDIPVGDLARGIESIGEISGLQIAYDNSFLNGKRGGAIKGQLTAQQALTRLLAGSGFTWQQVSENSVAIRVASKGKSSTASTNGARAVQGRASDASEHVLVEGDRLVSYDPTQNVDLPRTINDVQPYYIFDSEVIEDSGALTLEDFLKQRLTMNTAEQNNNQHYNLFGSSAGVALGNTSSINLRGLGANETLILVDGRRMAGVSVAGTQQQPDINGIPLAAIDRIEILPSSASAIYGASAVGGVVNIILKKNYSGGDLRYSYEQVASGSAPVSSLDGSYGFSAEGGKTQVMIGAHYGVTEPLHLADREGLVEQGINTILQQGGPSQIYNGFTPFFGGNVPNIASATYGPNGPVPLTLLNGTPLNSIYTYICPGTSPTTSAAALDSCLLSKAGKQNTALSRGVGIYGLQSPLGYSQKVESGMLTVRREMNNWLEGFFESSVEVNSGSSVYNPVAEVGNFFIPAGAPDNPFQQNVLMTTPSALALPLSVNSVNSSATLGLTAHLPHTWTLEGDYTWSRNQFSNHYFKVDSSIDDAGPPYTQDTGPVVSGAINPFVDQIAYPINYAPYLAPVTYDSTSTLDDIAIRAAGNYSLFSWTSPTAAVGLEHREESYPANSLLAVYPLTPIADNGTTWFKQLQSTDSVYAESTLPLVGKSNAVPGAKVLELQLAGRIERYSVDAGTSSVATDPYPNGIGGGPALVCYSPSLDAACQIPLPRSKSTYSSSNGTLGLRYKPIDDITVRASIGTAFLPPVFSQLLPNPQVNPNGDTITDPKTGATYQVSTIGGGNPNLMPEHDKNTDIGLIYQPVTGPFEGLRMDLEFFEMLQFDAIGGLSGDQILAIPQLASRVTRSPTTGLITQINESILNLNLSKAVGWDLSVNYRLASAIGTFEFTGVGSLLDHDENQYTSGGPFNEYAGYADSAKSKFNGTLTWRFRQWKLGWTTEWYDSYLLGPFGIVYPDGQSYRVPTQLYHDAFASYTLDKKAASAFSNFTLQLGIKDIFNSAPPFDPSAAPFYVSPYGDLRMRDLWLSIRKSF
jgi:outer membrane receptor protein involved in Fe transport